MKLPFTINFFRVTNILYLNIKRYYNAYNKKQGFPVSPTFQRKALSTLSFSFFFFKGGCEGGLSKGGGEGALGECTFNSLGHFSGIFLHSFK